MNARRQRLAAVLVTGAVGVLLGACGSGLYDASGVSVLEGGGLTCNEASQVVCGGVCTQEDASHCGASCDDCTGASIPAGATAACVRASGAAAGACGYECADGLLRCATGCCPATALAAGERFTCALAEGGSVSCWGANDGGQLGDGTTAARAVPGAVSLPGGAKAIAAGVSHACAVLQDGAVRCWGSDQAGQVSGTPSLSSSPALPAATPVNTGAVEVVAGASHTCARLEGGAIRCWGLPARTAGGASAVGEPDVGGPATALAAGRDHTCARLESGAIRCWGANASGQLGDGTTNDATAIPVLAIAASAMELVGARGDQTCAATGTDVENAIQCWGDSLGAAFGLESPQPTPETPLKKLDPVDPTIHAEVSLLAVGQKHVCVGDRTEAIECFGANDRGQLGGTPTGPTEAVTVPLPARASATAPIATALAAGADHTCAIVSGGRLRCWGANESGQLGNGATTDPGTGSIVAPLGR